MAPGKAADDTGRQKIHTMLTDLAHRLEWAVFFLLAFRVVIAWIAKENR